MRAAVLPEFEAPLVLEELELLPPGPRDVVVRPGAVEVCVTDSYATRPGPLSRPPAILGHSAAGVVEAVGSAVTTVAPGDRVLVAGTPACGDCFWCRRGEGHQCREIFEGGVRHVARRADGTLVSAAGGVGTYAEQLLVREYGVVRMDTTLPDEHLCLLSCGAASALGAVFGIARVGLGDTVAVLGAGRIGGWLLQAARLAGAVRVVAVEPLPERRKRAAALGASDVLDPADGDVVEQVRDLTGGRGVDAAFEATGGPGTAAAVRTAFAATRRGGVVVPLGMTDFGVTVDLPVNDLAMRGREVRSCQYGNVDLQRDLPRYARVLESGLLDPVAMVERTYPLPDAGSALAAAEDREVLTAVLLPNSD
ncbi:zinc-binding dehydrogenase [Pseudonocardia sp. MH-G8]|uniref:zinc-binding dehydrogenase n=1 Tax=Pseudonocardia sp. MH-G8 TaxID=1854588 RepID=UPI000BA0C8CE|nr:zinc-binding dehydrogenase [Pseudonocardia sp. MH-G8]OZM81344.1 alcohol dehydrogenase [Pseudonocardia sp. MH-G8]